jgi:hypothetical protein
MTTIAQDKYRINGHVILTPSEGHWLDRELLDVQGDNRPIYAAPRAYELTWELMDYPEWSALHMLYQQVEASGTCVVRLPAFAYATGTAWAFREYSGCTLAEPMSDSFFSEYVTNVTLLIANIRVV